MDISIKSDEDNNRKAKLKRNFYCNECGMEFKEGEDVVLCRECVKMYCQNYKCLHFHESNNERILIRIVDIKQNNEV